MAAAVTFDATDGDSTSIGGPTPTYTFPLTVAAASGGERVAVLASISDVSANNDWVSCTIDGVTATRVGTKIVGSGSGHAVMSAYRAAGTANTSINVVGVTGASYTSYAAFCACFKLSGASTMLAQTSATTNDPSLSVNTATGGAVIAAIFDFDQASGTHTWTGVTESFDSVRVFTGETFSGGCANISSGETPRAVSVDVSGTPSTSIAAAAWSFNATTTEVACLANDAISTSSVSQPAAVISGAVQPAELGGAARAYGRHLSRERWKDLLRQFEEERHRDDL